MQIKTEKRQALAAHIVRSISVNRACEGGRTTGNERFSVPRVDERQHKLVVDRYKKVEEACMGDG